MSPPFKDSTLIPLPAHMWWLAAEGRVFGPYERIQLVGFLRQGRLAAYSRMARAPQGPFAPARDWPDLTFLFAPAIPATPRPGASQALEAEPDAPKPPAPAEERLLLVLANLRTISGGELEMMLRTYGASVRVRGTVWLCRARLPAAGLRNALSRHLKSGEFLFVAEVKAADVAWFNLDAEIDRAVRRLSIAKD